MTIAVVSRQGDGRLPVPRHDVPPSLVCASLQGRCDLSHTPWSPERGTFLRLTEACHEEGCRRRTLPHKVIRSSPNEEPQPPPYWEAMWDATLSGHHPWWAAGGAAAPPAYARVSSRPTTRARGHPADGAGGGWQRRYETVPCHRPACSAQQRTRGTGRETSSGPWYTGQAACGVRSCHRVSSGVFQSTHAGRRGGNTP